MTTAYGPVLKIAWDRCCNCKQSVYHCPMGLSELWECFSTSETRADGNATRDSNTLDRIIPTNEFCMALGSCWLKTISTDTSHQRQKPGAFRPYFIIFSSMLRIPAQILLLMALCPSWGQLLLLTKVPRPATWPLMWSSSPAQKLQNPVAF